MSIVASRRIRSAFNRILTVWERVAYVCVGAHVQILIHELGHLIASLAFGRRATGLRIGEGPSVDLFRFSRFPIRIGLYPRSGRVEVRPPDSPWQAAIAYAAGPAATIIVAAGFFDFHPHGWSSWMLDGWLILLWGYPGIENMFPYRPDGKAFFENVRKHFAKTEASQAAE
jgi:hypothetical protein